MVLTPGLAVDRTGMRIGQGGGCYDRVLGRVPVGTFTCACSTTTRSSSGARPGPTTGRVGAVATPSGISRLARGH